MGCEPAMECGCQFWTNHSGSSGGVFCRCAEPTYDERGEMNSRVEWRSTCGGDCARYHTRRQARLNQATLIASDWRNVRDLRRLVAVEKGGPGVTRPVGAETLGGTDTRVTVAFNNLSRVCEAFLAGASAGRSGVPVGVVGEGEVGAPLRRD